MKIQHTTKHNNIYWAYNLPIQMRARYEDYDNEEGEIVGWEVVNYMPRKERLCRLDDYVLEDELKNYCQNAAEIYRNLANQFEALAERKIDYIYYPDDEKWKNE